MLCFLGGIFGEDFIRLLFNMNVSVDTAGYLEKVGLFAGSGIAGYFIYKYYVKTSVLLKRLYHAQISFRAMCVYIGVFFALILISSFTFSMPLYRVLFS